MQPVANVRHFVETVCWPDAAKPSTAIQEVARKSRYDLLAHRCDAEGVRHLLTAHHQDDNIETLFLRARSGSGFEGLACIQPLRTYRAFFSEPLPTGQDPSLFARDAGLASNAMNSICSSRHHATLPTAARGAAHSPETTFNDRLGTRASRLTTRQVEVRTPPTLFQLTISRPLLGFRKDELRDFCTSNRIAWAEDPTNSSTKYTRNALRMELAAMFAERPVMREECLAFISLMRTARNFLSRAASEILPLCVSVDERLGHAFVDWKVLRVAAPALQRKCLSLILQHISASDYPAASDQLDRLLASLHRCWPALSTGMDSAHARDRGVAVRRTKASSSNLSFTHLHSLGGCLIGVTKQSLVIRIQPHPSPLPDTPLFLHGPVWWSRRYLVSPPVRQGVHIVDSASDTQNVTDKPVKQPPETRLSFPSVHKADCDSSAASTAQDRSKAESQQGQQTLTVRSLTKRDVRALQLPHTDPSLLTLPVIGCTHTPTAAVPHLDLLLCDCARGVTVTWAPAFDAFASANVCPAELV
jgi:tRNA(Ile)-lysidine synthase TilS/MesJ